MRGPTAFYYLLFLLPLPAAAQQQPPSAQQTPPPPQILYGRIKRQQSPEVLAAVTVINRTLGKTNRSDAGGNYRIEAHPGDTILFSSAGYLPDTNFVAAWMLNDKDGYDMYLRPNIVTLPSVLVDESSKYQIDSLQRMDDYKWIYMMHHDAVVSDTNFTQGVGLSFDLNFFNEHQREKRRLRKRLAEEEKDYYIDFRCPPAWVERITGLHDDSLRFFLLHYRPTYNFCRSASNEDIFLYINDQVKKYRHPTAPPPISRPSTSPPPGKRRSSAAPPPSGSAPKPAPALSPPPGSAAAPRITHTDLSSTVVSAAPSP